MEYMDNNAYEILENPEGADYDMWDSCFIHPLSYGKPNQQYPAIPSTSVKLQHEYMILCLTMSMDAPATISLLVRRVRGLS